LETNLRDPSLRPGRLSDPLCRRLPAEAQRRRVVQKQKQKQKQKEKENQK
jgi:hypothetical protein